MMTDDTRCLYEELDILRNDRLMYSCIYGKSQVNIGMQITSGISQILQRVRCDSTDQLAQDW